MRQGVKPDRTSVPITADATAETVALHRWLLTAKQHRRYALGISDMLRGMPSGGATPAPTPTLYETQQVFFDQTQRWPGFFSMEYHDPAWSNRYGSAGTDHIRAAMLQAAERGAILSLHNHPGNPVTGQLSRNGLSWSDPQTNTGNFGDRNGSPLAAIKTGGAQEAQFLAFLDRLADFIDSLVNSTGRKIPVVLRMFHECGTGTWFWWNGADRAADMILVWRKMVDYLRNTKGLKNVLYCWNVNAQASANFFPWWPGSAYVDMLSIDQYDLRDSADINLDGASDYLKPCWDFISGYATSANKSLAVAELGYQYTATRGSADLWTSKTGDRINSKYAQSSIACLWPSPYGPGAADPQAVKDSLKAWADSPNALTADKLSGIYTTLL